MSATPVQRRHLRREKFRNAQQAWKALRSKFKDYEDRGLMTYEKVLGFGGFGIVQRWSLNERDRLGRNRTVAIKTIIRPDKEHCVAALQREIWWNKRFTGSEHLVQLVDLPKEVLDEVGADINNDECQGIPIMVMEELGLGSLADLVDRIWASIDLNPELPRADRMMEYIPSRVLWVTRACIGMAYSSVHSESRKGQAIRETTLDWPDYVQQSKLIHNDIDVQNVFIAEPSGIEDKEHSLNPVVKIADYGCMVEWDSTWSYEKRSDSLWGKSAFKAPEQFDPDGNMDVHTNIYQIGNTMHDLITLGHVSYNERFAGTRRVRGIDGDFRTYGFRLVESDTYQIVFDWGNVDIGLRELVAACMAEDHRWRPALVDLELMCRRRIRELDMGVKYAETIIEEGLRPISEDFVAGGPLDDISYRKRVPGGAIEPNRIVEKFYKDYFINAWDESDKYSSYWSADVPEDSPPPPGPPPRPAGRVRFVTPVPEARSSTAVPGGVTIEPVRRPGAREPAPPTGSGPSSPMFSISL
ncbi:hypothetical protein ANO14919_008120 [Xylariales sp. No.14919]|nr:kinase-like protein [Xylaria grammica]GAW11466.1 hypothetical protein ANO14919_008120 [Xylariales sp. No.14919]